MVENHFLNRIAIVAVCDNNYIMLLATLLKSIEINNKDREGIDFYIIDDNISAKNQIRLERSINKDHISIHWLNMVDVIPKDAILPSDTSTYPLNIYVRLFIPHFIPQERERVIYLDVDMLVLKNIAELWETDLEGKIIGAVQDTFGTAYYGIKNYEELGIPAESKYFNSGLLLIDMKRWRENQTTESLIECLRQNRLYAKYPDQYGLNVVLANKWFELNPKWNTYTYETEENPYLIHYIGYKPIYQDYNGKKEYKDVFYHYLNLTEWKGYSPKSKYLRYLSKFRTKLKKMLNYY